MRARVIPARAALWLCLALAGPSLAAPPAGAPVVAKRVLDVQQGGSNRLNAAAWRGYESGFTNRGGAFVCDNGSDQGGRRGLYQYVELNQRVPQPIVASAWSRAESVGGLRDSDYSIYLDLQYADGTPLWGQTADFTPGSHDFERREVVVLPEKPVKSLAFYLLLRGHPGRAEFRDAELHELATPAGACVFDGLPVAPAPAAGPGFQVRDAAAGSDFLRIEREALGLRIETRRSGDYINVTVTDTTGKDRAITLVYAVPVEGDGWTWLANPRRSEVAEAGREYMTTHPQPAGRGRLSRYPFAAIANGRRGLGIGIDMDHPAFFRAGFNAGTRELFLAYDLGLIPEKPQAQLRFCVFDFDPAWQFRAALARYYELFPDQFRCRVPKQGLWMPFAKISKVPGWEDFGFRFKEGHDETAWDDAHDILTFRYTEPMTWWMRMAKEIPRTLEASLAEAARLAARGDPAARAFITSGYRDAAGGPPARLLDEPWCNGAVWSMNSMPGVAGEFTDFNIKWNRRIRDELYGPGRKGDLDGEYVDSSEGYVTDVLDYRREHLVAADTPLTFSPDGQRPAVHRGLIVFEYLRAIARDVHGMGKLMMANATPASLCWLAPNLDVLGTESDWNPGGRWQPMSDDELLYRRALCRGKPYCFLMNTEFTRLPPARVETYMQRCLAYGMFPGFFSADASTGQYFERPELYERDRPLFRKYVPLCRRVAEAGWQPITGARTSDEKIRVERFGDRYLTVFNDSAEQRSAVVTLDGDPPAAGRELVSGAAVQWTNRTATITLAPESVAVLEIR